MVLLSGHASAHQWTPTYPELKPSYVQGINYVKMELFNSRQDINWYQVSVFDGEWNPVPFAVAGDRIIQVRHLQRKIVEVYIRDKDSERATYVCSRSKMISEGERDPFLSSRICSKIK